jgi:hypothetical protein
MSLMGRADRTDDRQPWLTAHDDTTGEHQKRLVPFVP